MMPDGSQYLKTSCSCNCKNMNYLNEKCIVKLKWQGLELYTGELRYDRPSGTRKIGSSYAKSVICICSVRHVPVCMLLHWGPHLIGIKVKIAKEYAWLDFYYTCICLLHELPDGVNRVLSGRTYLSTCLSLGRSKPTAFVRHTQY